MHYHSSFTMLVCYRSNMNIEQAQALIVLIAFQFVETFCFIFFDSMYISEAPNRKRPSTPFCDAVCRLRVDSELCWLYLRQVIKSVRAHLLGSMTHWHWSTISVGRCDMQYPSSGPQGKSYKTLMTSNRDFTHLWFVHSFSGLVQLAVACDRHPMFHKQICRWQRTKKGITNLSIKLCQD